MTTHWFAKHRLLLYGKYRDRHNQRSVGQISNTHRFPLKIRSPELRNTTKDRLNCYSNSTKCFKNSNMALKSVPFRLAILALKNNKNNGIEWFEIFEKSVDEPIPMHSASQNGTRLVCHWFAAGIRVLCVICIRNEMWNKRTTKRPYKLSHSSISAQIHHKLKNNRSFVYHFLYAFVLCQCWELLLFEVQQTIQRIFNCHPMPIRTHKCIEKYIYIYQWIVRLINRSVTLYMCWLYDSVQDWTLNTSNTAHRIGHSIFSFFFCLRSIRILILWDVK